MANEISTAGVLFKYCVETTAGTRPTTGYTILPNIVSTPEINSSPESLEVTDLSDLVWRRYIQGLKDPGGALTLTANFTAAFKTAWTALVTAYTTAKASNKATWFEIMIPGIASFYFAGIPDNLGINGYEINSVTQIDVHVTPNQIEGWGNSSTASVNPNNVTVKVGSSVAVTYWGFEGTPTTSFSTASKASASVNASAHTVTITGTATGTTNLTLTDTDGDTAVIHITVVSA